MVDAHKVLDAVGMPLRRNNTELRRGRRHDEPPNPPEHVSRIPRRKHCEDLAGRSMIALVLAATIFAAVFIVPAQQHDNDQPISVIGKARK
jgi:hypothetical protein